MLSYIFSLWKTWDEYYDNLSSFVTTRKKDSDEQELIDRRI